MKKKIIIGLSIFSLIFLIGGIYIITTIETATSKLDNLVKLHQVEILREHLLIRIKRVQSDLNLKNTRYARSIDTVITNVKNMETMSDTCFKCHHSTDVTNRLKDLKTEVKAYKNSLSRVFTISANMRRLEAEEDMAFEIGEQLITKVNNMISMASITLESKTQSSLREIAQTKSILYILVAIVPFLAAGLGFIFIRGFTKPVNVLLQATRKLESGNLDYQIEGLSDEFREVAISFNKMSTSLKNYMHKIEESEKRYRTLFESAGDAIFMINAEGENIGKIESANQAAAEMHGYTVNELLELNMINDLDTEKTAMEAQNRIQRILNGEWIHIEINHRRKDGSVFPVEVSAGLLEFMDHKYILAFDRDITERKQVEDTLKRAGQMRLVGEWAAGLAHEIKNSLAGIKISVEILLEEKCILNEDKTTIHKAVDEIKRIEFLLKSLLNFARPPKLQFIITNINEVLDNAISYSLLQSSLTPEAIEKIQIIKDLDSNLPETMADQLQLRQLFLNILINASQAMEDGGTLSAKTYYEKETATVNIEISDTGEGIDNEVKDKIFQPFFTTKSKGTGLGLAISKRIIEQHEGNISAQARPGGGTVFYINLPVKNNEKEQII